MQSLTVAIPVLVESQCNLVKFLLFFKKKKVCDTILNHFLSAVRLSTSPPAAKWESELQVKVIQEGMEG